MKNIKNKVLITGVAGLLGSHFSKYLLDLGYDVYGIDDLSGGYLEYIDKRLIQNNHFYQMNLQDDVKLKEIFNEIKPNFVYHFAAYAAEGLSPFIRKFNYENNIISSINIINNCVNLDIDKLIFTSSMAVYGEGIPPFIETQQQSPIDPYGIAKYAVEQDIISANKQFGLQYNIIRPHNVIGINQNIWDRYRNVIGIWIRKILNGEDITIFGDGEQKRAFSDISFYMKPFKMLMVSQNNETFNIGADKEFKLIDVANLVKVIGEKYDYKSSIVHLEPRHEVKIAYSNHDKAKDLLNFNDGTDIRSTIEEMFVWALTQENRNIKNMDYEIEKGLYSYWKK